MNTIYCVDFIFRFLDLSKNYDLTLKTFIDRTLEIDDICIQKVFQ